MEASTIPFFTLNCINGIADFDGWDPNQLTDFIKQIEDILPTVLTFDVCNQKILFNFLKGRCVGKTREIIHKYG